jgi:hypothetical protein
VGSEWSRREVKKMKNLAAKTVKPEDAYEYWLTTALAAGPWVTAVLKKWQADDDKPYARWFVKAYTPFVPEGEMGDNYVTEVKRGAVKVTKAEALTALVELNGGTF